MTDLWTELGYVWKGAVLMAGHPYGWAAMAILAAFGLAVWVRSRRQA